MNRKILYILGLGGLLLFFLLNNGTSKNSKDRDVVAKIALREVGHKLLLYNNDSFSRVLPILKLSEDKFKLSFEEELAMLPDTLVNLVERYIASTALPNNYRIEVLQCSTGAVVYSYEMKTSKDTIPCQKRLLPKNCYTIEIQFIIKQQTNLFDKKWLIMTLLLLGFIITLYIFDRKQKFFQNQGKQSLLLEDDESDIIAIGKYSFHPEQAKLVLDSSSDILLSKKECEVLEILVLKLNKVVKREELVKAVWEDKGVYVGRSLDAYISKLRKKLKEDTNIKLINIHGIGYKLEIEN